MAFRFIAVYEILGGLYAFATSLWLLVSELRSGRSEGVEAVAIFATAGIVSIVAGVRLLRQLPGGKALSLTVQAAQVALVVTPLIHYSAFLLLRLTVSLLNGELTFGAEWGGGFYWRMGNSSAFAGQEEIGVNVLAAALCVYIWLSERVATARLLRAS